MLKDPEQSVRRTGIPPWRRVVVLLLSEQIRIEVPLLPEVDVLPTSPPAAEAPPAAPLIRILERELPVFVGLKTPK